MSSVSGVCECLVMPPDWELRFGGRKPARIICKHCKREYSLDGELAST